jgi:mRNA interferase RelE/StbE
VSSSGTKPSYHIRWQEEATKDMSALPKHIAQRVYDKVTTHLAHAPRELGKALTGEWRHYYRYRIGDYRVIYRIEETEVTITVIGVGHRRDIYE